LISVKSTTTGLDIFTAFTDAVDKFGLDWNTLVSITTDGAPSMVGRINGFVALVRENKSTTFLDYHCIIHQQSLCGKLCDGELQSVMSTVTKLVNVIRARALNHRQFRNFLADLDTEYPDVVMFNSVRWLSRGAVLKRFCSLLSELRSFLSSICKDCPELNDDVFLMHLGILTDVTLHLSELNLQLQGKGKLIFELFTQVSSFKDMLCLFVAQIESNDFTQFPTVAKLSIDSEAAAEKLLSCLRELQTNFEDRFSDFNRRGDLFLFAENPFLCDVNTCSVAPYFNMDKAKLNFN